ncbi:MAG: hypothetical protein AB8V06_07855 [Francisella endosymbiont of Hyalomma asiaticum]
MDVIILLKFLMNDISDINKVSSYISHSKSYRAAVNHGQKVLCVGYS